MAFEDSGSSFTVTLKLDLSSFSRDMEEAKKTSAKVANAILADQTDIDKQILSTHVQLQKDIERANNEHMNMMQKRESAMYDQWIKDSSRATEHIKSDMKSVSDTMQQYYSPKMRFIPGSEYFSPWTAKDTGTTKTGAEQLAAMGIEQVKVGNNWKYIEKNTQIASVATKVAGQTAKTSALEWVMMGSAIRGVGQTLETLTGVHGLSRMSYGLSNFTNIARIGFTQMAATIAPLLPLIGALGAVVTSAIGISIGIKAGNAMAKYVIEMRNMAEQTGLVINAVQTLKFAAEAQGASWASIRSVMNIFTRNLGEHQEKFAKYSITTKSVEAALSDVFKVYEKLPNTIQKASMASELFGGAGSRQQYREFILLLEAGSESYEKMRKKIEESLNITDLAVERAVKLQEAHTYLDIAWKRLTASVAVSGTVWSTWYAQAKTSIWETLAKRFERLNQLVQEFQFLVTGGWFVTTWDDFQKALNLSKKGLEELNAEFENKKSLEEYYQTISKVADSLGQIFKGDLDTQRAIATYEWEHSKKTFDDAVKYQLKLRQIQDEYDDQTAKRLDDKAKSEDKAIKDAENYAKSVRDLFPKPEELNFYDEYLKSQNEENKQAEALIDTYLKLKGIKDGLKGINEGLMKGKAEAYIPELELPNYQKLYDNMGTFSYGFRNEWKKNRDKFTKDFSNMERAGKMFADGMDHSIGKISGSLSHLIVYGGKFKVIMAQALKEIATEALQVVIKLGLLNIAETLFGEISSVSNSTFTAGMAANTASVLTLNSALAVTIAELTAIAILSGGTSLGYGAGGAFGPSKMFGIPFEKGGIVPEAQHGLYTGKFRGGMPAILHSNEVVLPLPYIRNFFGSIAENLFAGKGMTTSEPSPTGESIYITINRPTSFDDLLRGIKTRGKEIREALNKDRYARG